MSQLLLLQHCPEGPERDPCLFPGMCPQVPAEAFRRAGLDSVGLVGPKIHISNELPGCSKLQVYGPHLEYRDSRPGILVHPGSPPGLIESTFPRVTVPQLLSRVHAGGFPSGRMTAAELRKVASLILGSQTSTPAVLGVGTAPNVFLTLCYPAPYCCMRNDSPS